eukprot:5572272-Pyramimonas_sp.AAC.1
MSAAPTQVQTIILLLARKHKEGGRRVLGHVPAFWLGAGHAASTSMQELGENEGAGGQLSATQKRSPDDTVRRQSVQAE